MYECPHCHEPGISFWRKMALGPAVPATCQCCGQKVGVPYGKSFAAMAPMLTPVVPLLVFESLFMTILLFGVTMVITGVLYAKWVPLEQRF